MRIKPFVARIVPLLAITLLSSGPVVVASDSFYLTTIPILLVASPEDKPIRVPSYVVIQVAHLWHPLGPEVLFNEGARGLGAFKGRVFSADWKEAAQKAALAASSAVGEDPRTWQVTLKGDRKSTRLNSSHVSIS